MIKKKEEGRTKKERRRKFPIDITLRFTQTILADIILSSARTQIFLNSLTS